MKRTEWEDAAFNAVKAYYNNEFDAAFRLVAYAATVQSGSNPRWYKRFVSDLDTAVLTRGPA